MLVATEGSTKHHDSVMSEIAALERKAAMLIRQQQDAQAEIQQLREDNARLASELSQKDEQIARFQNTIKINKIANQTVADKSETTELKRTINEYIKKIDRCIAQLSQ